MPGCATLTTGVLIIFAAAAAAALFDYHYHGPMFILRVHV
jgi:hypothetical protein